MWVNRCTRNALRTYTSLAQMRSIRTRANKLSAASMSHPILKAHAAPTAHKRVRFFQTEKDGKNEENSKTEETNTKENESKKEEESVNTVKVKILDNALDFVVDHGWSRKALSCGAEQAGYAGVAEGMFTGGGDDLVLYFIQKCNFQLVEYLKFTVEEHESKEEKIKVTSFIRSAVEYRLRMIIPCIGAWPQAMGILARPDIFPKSAEELAKMVDDIWYYAGDRSADINWYTKRGILAKLYGSTQLVMLTDQSPDFKDTWEFLDRRISDISNFAKISQSVKDNGSAFVETAFSGAKVLKNIAGFGDTKR
nr:ubiquinone biosynthesis protein COQ9-B, mitochondrial [Ciona intestinalis]|eukprot:XP_002121764.1 ubiquinone biosynthesis protein COQ9-B, mitochondrial [Ciona intestinalis]